MTRSSMMGILMMEYQQMCHSKKDENLLKLTAYNHPECSIYNREPPHSFATRCNHFIMIAEYLHPPESEDRSSISRIFKRKNVIVEQSKIPVLSNPPRAGTKFFSAITRMVLTTITAVRISFLLQLPSSLYILFAFSFRPGIRDCSGLQTIMKKPHSKKTMSQPTGNMYMES